MHLGNICLLYDHFKSQRKFARKWPSATTPISTKQLGSIVDLEPSKTVWVMFNWITVPFMAHLKEFQCGFLGLHGWLHIGLRYSLQWFVHWKIAKCLFTTPEIIDSGALKTWKTNLFISLNKHALLRCVSTLWAPTQTSLPTKIT